MQRRGIRHKPELEQGKAHRELMLARLAQAETVSKSHPYVRWIAIKDVAACQSCLALDGKHFSVLDAGWEACVPPSHEGCRCRISSARKLPEGVTVEPLSRYFEL